MLPRIAIPVPHSTDPEYAERAFPQYAHAVEMAGGDPVRIPLDQSPTEVMKLIGRIDAVLIARKQSRYRPGEVRGCARPQTAPADPLRDAIDGLLLRDAYTLRKPILGICYGLQILNVFRGGTLLQHIESPVNHEAGRAVPIAHTVEVDSGSRLARLSFHHRRKSMFPSRSTPVIINQQRRSARIFASWLDVRRMESSRR